VNVLRTSGLLTGLLLLGLTAAGPAAATLGGDRSTVETDRAALNGVRSESSAAGYEVEEIATPGGGRVREYLTPDGKVFALSWRGPRIPDLRQLLGAYYERFAESGTQPHIASRRHLVIRQPGLVVESHGRMGAFVGRAWDPQLLPQSFSSDAIL
jgi:Protein of unknown function (DUF2844)